MMSLSHLNTPPSGGLSGMTTSCNMAALKTNRQKVHHALLAVTAVSKKRKTSVF